LKACLPWLDYVASTLKPLLRSTAFLELRTLIEPVRILKECSVDYEFRTTVVPGLVDAEDIKRIGEVVRDAKRLALQQFVPENAYSAEYKAVKPYDAETIRRFAETLKPYVKTALGGGYDYPSQITQQDIQRHSKTYSSPSASLFYFSFARWLLLNWLKMALIPLLRVFEPLSKMALTLIAPI
jgi:hypothetical protein